MEIQWFIFVAFVFILVQSSLFIKLGPKKITYKRYFSSPAVFEGEQAEMIEEITNEKLLPVPWIRMESRISPELKFKSEGDLEVKHEQFHKSLFSLLPFMKITRRHNMTCSKRGCYDLKTVTLTGGDLFGTNDFSKTFQLEARILVFPRPVSIGEVPIDSHSWQGDVTVKRWIVDDPFMITGTREYSPGDPLNRINWNATARTNVMQVHSRDFTANPRIMILMNIDITEGMWHSITRPDLIEMGISWAAAIAQYSIGRGIETGFGSNAQMVDTGELDPVREEPKSSKEHLRTLFEVMAKLVLERAVTFFTFLEEEIRLKRRGVDYIILTLYESERMAAQIDRLERMGNSVRVIKLEDEKDKRAETNG